MSFEQLVSFVFCIIYYVPIYFRNTGLLWMGSEQYVNKLGKTIGDAGCTHEILDHEQVVSSFFAYFTRVFNDHLR